MKNKEEYVVNEIQNLMRMFDPKNIKLKNLDRINVSFAFEPKKNSNFDKLSKMGYTKDTNDYLSVYSKWDNTMSYATNVSVDKSQNLVTISVNY